MSIEISDRDMAEIERHRRDQQRRAGRCNHDERTFTPEDRVARIDAALICDECGHTLLGEPAKDARDAGLATTEVTRKALPSGQ